MSKFYITTPIYYVNGSPHIGHAYTTIIADVLARYHRLLGDKVFFLTGTDEHGSKVAKSAEMAGKTPLEFCDEYSAKFQLAWEELNISHNRFIRTTEADHKNGVAVFLNKLKASGAIYQGEYQGLYCSGCERFLTEKDLIDGKCPDHLKEPEVVKEKNYFFNLKKFLPEIERLIDTREIKIVPESYRREVLGFFKQNLDDFSISRESVKWGIELPFDKTQVTYVWIEALQNYLTGIGYGYNDKQFQEFWPADVHLMSKDIIKFHTIFWPALLLAVGEKVPKHIFVHGFFTIDGQKMGKSLGNVIDPVALAEQFGSDVVRYLLLSQFPLGSDGDIKAANFALQYNSDLANGLGNLVSRVVAMNEKYFAGVVPVASKKELVTEVKNVWQEYETAMQEFAVDKALAQIRHLNKVCDEFVDQHKPWELAKQGDTEALKEAIYGLLEGIRNLAVMLYPFMPETSARILEQFGFADFTSRSFSELKTWGLLSAGTIIVKADGLFPRIK
ncbi:MAG: methionine--tRNA ligase [bacterium]